MRQVERRRVLCSGQHRDREQHDEQRLHHEEAEELALVALPVRAQIGISAVFGLAQHPVQQVQAEPEAPESAQHGDRDARGDITLGEPAEAERRTAEHQGPGHVDEAGIAAAPLQQPDQAHHQGGDEAEPEQGLQQWIHAGLASRATSRTAMAASKGIAIAQATASATSVCTCGAVKATASNTRDAPT